MSSLFPKEIKKHIIGKKYYCENIGRSGSDVFIFDEFVLKTENSSPTSDNEHYILETLCNILPIPKVIAFAQKNGKNFLLMTKLCGEMACSKKYISLPETTVCALADSLKILWNTDITQYFLPDADKSDLDAAYKRIAEGNVSTHIDGIGNEEEIYSFLVSHRPSDEKVFSHGDLCLPNVFLNNGKVSGFLDLGSAGVSSKWRDIETCLWSIHYNFCELSGMCEEEYSEYEKLFFERLGIKKNEEMIFYYSAFSSLF